MDVERLVEPYVGEKVQAAVEEGNSPTIRRSPMSQSWPVSLRNGVMASVTSRSLSVQSPVEWVMASMGLAPRFAVAAFQMSNASGARHTGKIASLSQPTRVI